MVPRFGLSLTLALAFTSLLSSAPVFAQASGQGRGRNALDPQALVRLEAEAGGAANVSLHPATSVPRFVRLRAGRPQAAAAAAGRHEGSMAFIREYAGLYGIGDPASSLRAAGEQRDRVGGSHLTYLQEYRGVPVFAGVLKTHYDANGALTAVSGTLIPNIAVDPTPSISRDAAAGAALASMMKGFAVDGLGVRSVSPRPYVFRTGLAQGIEGQNHLVWEVEVGNGTTVRQMVYVDAHTAVVVDRINRVEDALNRRAFNTEATYPATPYWVEGDPFPTADAEANNVIQFSGETYDMFATTFGRDSYDGAGATMDTVFRRTAQCPNASWNGAFTSYCAGVSGDDIVGHEWGHAYTEYTHGLIYQWQPGALNESYSDIFGEIVDVLNGTGLDSPATPRTAGSCSAFTPFPPVVRINSPASIAGDYTAGGAQFGPPLTSDGLTGDVVLVDDGVGTGTPPSASTTDGCETPFANAADVAGKIALVDRGTCSFTIKVKNAQLNGAVGVIVANHVSGGDAVLTMSGVDPTITIPSAFIGYSDGNTIKSELAAGVNATLRVNAPPATDESYRWLVGEDAPSFGGAIRDMWDPTCYNHPGKVSDAEYYCSADDNGGVHYNSGVPNHGFALLVDGGSYNGQSVVGLGLTKAAHLYYHAMTAYQDSASDFAAHADALEQSCSDLTGSPLTGFDGESSGETITSFDCVQVAGMIAAVELRTPPAQCDFQPLLAKDAPDRCEVGTTQVNIFTDTFEQPPQGWTVSHTSPSATFTPRDWEWVSTLPDRAGSAFFGSDPNIGQCTPADDQSGVLHLDSPAVSLPSGAVDARLTFDHWVATEPGWDGGNLEVSVSGGPWQPVSPSDFTFNSYNTTLATAEQGNSNPLAGQPAFSGTDGGSVSGSWGRSHVNLAPYAGPNETVSLRFNMGTDACTGRFGWYVDDVTIYSCTSNAIPSASVNDIAVTEGTGGLTNAAFTVTLSHASSQPVTVRYKLRRGTAKPGVDYLPAGQSGPDGTQGAAAVSADTSAERGEGRPEAEALMTVEIPPLAISAEIVVRIVGDGRAEPNERFFVILADAWNATIGDGLGEATILDDDAATPRD